MPAAPFSGPYPSVDTTKPTTPGAPVVSNAASNQTATVTFAASSDAVGVAGYAAYLDGSEIEAARSATNTILLKGVPAGSHSVVVRAFDAAGNVSDASAGTGFVIPEVVTIDINRDKKHFAEIGYIAAGGNYVTNGVSRFKTINSGNYTNSNAALSAPTKVASATGMHICDITMQCDIGDIIVYEAELIVLNMNAASTGLLLSVWSEGGSLYRNWTSGTTFAAITQDASAATCPYSGGAAVKISVSRKIIASDLSANGYATFSLYGTNSNNTGLQSYTFDRSCLLATNLRKGKHLSTVYAYPNGAIGSSCVIPGMAGGDNNFPSLPVVSSGIFDLKIPAQLLDIIKVRLNLGVQQPGRLWFSVWSVGGSITRNFFDNKLYGDELVAATKGLVETAAGGILQRISTFTANRALEGDIDSNGFVTLQLRYSHADSSSTAAGTINASDSAGGISYLSAVNLGSAVKYSALGLQGLGSQAGLAWEPAIWEQDNKLHLIHTAKTGGLCHATADSPYGPWTYTASLLSAINQESSVLYDNGILYVYVPSANNTGISCYSGASYDALVFAGVVFTPSGTASQAFNSSIVKGPGGLYYLYIECRSSATGARWQLYVATSSSPTGVFTIQNGGNHLESLNVLTSGTSTVNGPDIHWNGLFFTLIHHACPVANNVVPSLLYKAVSVDGINWTRESLRLDGTPIPLHRPMQEIGHDQNADPIYVDFKGRGYLLYSEMYGSGGINNTGAIACTELF